MMGELTKDGIITFNRTSLVLKFFIETQKLETNRI
jgi:hypothetical protein